MATEKGLSARDHKIMTSLFMVTNNRPAPGPTPKDDKKDQVASASAAASNSSNNKGLGSIGNTIMRNFERFTTIIDESLESDSLLPSLCMQGDKQGLNDTSYTDDTGMNTTADTSNGSVIIPSLKNECNLHFASWLESQDFDASGIVSNCLEEDVSTLGRSFQFSRDEFLEASDDDYVSISGKVERRNRWPPQIPLAVTNAWDSIFSSNWRCWQG